MSKTKTAQPKSKPAPKATQIKAFAKQFTKEQWATLCKEQDFLDIVCEHTLKAEMMARKILKGTYNTEE